MITRRALGAAAFAAALASTTCTRTRELPPCDESSALPDPPRDPDAAVVVAVGDIAECPGGHQAETAALTARIAPDAVLTLGDTVYPNGTLDEFVDCYGATWGQFRRITRAAVGNHEYHSPHAGPFYAYFCGSTGEPFHGYTSFDIGRWHAVVLNSNCGPDLDLPDGTKGEFGGCDADSPQAQWLAADLEAHPTQCTLAMAHHPRWSSGPYGNQDHMRALFRVLHAHGVDLALSGHAHSYERFAPMDADGQRDDARGVSLFVVGTGGKELVPFQHDADNSVARTDATFGVLRLTLRADRAEFAYLDIDGHEVDRGEVPCHD